MPITLLPADAFITRLFTTSAGAQMVVATVPDAAEDKRCKGMPFSSDMCDCSKSLKKSYDTSWDAFINTARIYISGVVVGLTVLGAKPRARLEAPSSLTIRYTP
jgi:hypothetical protein